MTRPFKAPRCINAKDISDAATGHTQEQDEDMSDLDTQSVDDFLELSAEEELDEQEPYSLSRYSRRSEPTPDLSTLVQACLDSTSKLTTLLTLYLDYRSETGTSTTSTSTSGGNSSATVSKSPIGFKVVSQAPSKTSSSKQWERKQQLSTSRVLPLL